LLDTAINDALECDLADQLDADLDVELHALDRTLDQTRDLFEASDSRFLLPEAAQHVEAPMWWRPVMVTYALGLIGLVLGLKTQLIEHSPNILLTVYGLTVVTYVATNALMALRYKPQPIVADDLLPRIAVVIPAYNEPQAALTTIRSVLACNYPEGKLEVIFVDDGSTDDTWDNVAALAAQDSRITALRQNVNAGKRAAMATGYQALTGQEVVVFVDSDTQLAADSIKALVSPLVTRAHIGAVTGHAEVANPGANVLSRLQQVRYFAAFRLIKAAESTTGKVICASGCFSAYRTSMLDQIFDKWLAQTFLGQHATYGDDRALTTDTLNAGWDVVYQSNAVCWTNVPVRLKTFWRQQLRWKKSWTRESLRLGSFAFKLGVVVAPRIYTNILMQLAGPIVLTYMLVWRPVTTGSAPWMYLLGIFTMATLYGLFYAVMRRSSSWWNGVAYSIVYSTIMCWQTYLALFKLRDNSWGTRTSNVTEKRTVEIAETITGQGTLADLVASTGPAPDTRWTSGVIAVLVTALPIVLTVAGITGHLGS